MPTSRYLMAAAITANYLYVVGGLPLTATPAGGLLEMYATQADTWATGTRFRVRSTSQRTTMCFACRGSREL